MSSSDRELDELIKDLRVFIELSFQEGEVSLREWINEIFSNIEGHCWIKHHCNKSDCPAYKNLVSGRCWLIAGTMCGEKTSHSLISIAHAWNVKCLKM